MSTTMTHFCRAQTLAKIAHAKQVDKAGRPYVEHLWRVADRCEDVHQKTVAWLHDIIEDTPTSGHDLLTLGFPEEVVKDVEILTETSGITYRDYIANIARLDSDASLEVKLADLHDHLQDTSAISDSLVSRYKLALLELTREARRRGRKRKERRAS